MTQTAWLASMVAGVLEVPVHRWLGLARPATGVGLRVGPEAVNNTGVLHGGLAAVLLDVACYLAVLATLAEGDNAVTHDAFVSLLRPVPRGAALQVRGRVLRRGRRVAFCAAEATLGDHGAGELVIAGHVTKSVLAGTTRG